MGRRIAVVLFNLGGPDRQENIRPFLENLFKDPAIIRAPAPIRFLLSRLISRTRAPAVKKNYAMMNVPGGGSPLLAETRKQADALVSELSERMPGDEFRAFIAMRYWHPFTHEAAAEVAEWEPDETILLPLYPQFSSTTTGSSLAEWNRHFAQPVRTLCCYPFNQDFIASHAGRIMECWKAAGQPGNVKLLMSAHGLPESVVKKGDPYQFQVEEMARRLREHLPEEWDTQVCYQSRVGPLKWIGPDTETEVEAAANAGKNILIAPVAFVSDHIETLVELGEEYREIAEDNGAAGYHTVPALGTDELFIKALADETVATLNASGRLRSCDGGRICPEGYSDCPFAQMEN